MCGATSQDLYVQPDTNLGERHCKKIVTFVPFKPCRKYNSIFENLAIAESKEISDITGCLKPCHYKKYILGEPSPSNFKSKHYIFSMWAVSSKTKVETEELIYPMSTLVAEFGGTLGLFLGFSFISVWDNFSTLKRCIVFFKSKS